MSNKLKARDDVREIYLDLLKNSLTRYIFDDGYLPLHLRTHGKVKGVLYKSIEKILNPFNLELVKHNQFDPELRSVGKDWPATAETMIGLTRLDNIQYCMEEVLKKNIKGDFIETGAWRGGATIFMRGILRAYSVKNRKVWVADSFKGLPQTSSESHNQDIEDRLWAYPQLSISLREVKRNFSKYDLLDNQVKFLEGWFKDTLPVAPIKNLALIRLDGDMYESTMDSLNVLYPKLSIGGYIIVDDYCLPQCREAIKDFRSKMKIKSKIRRIDWSSIYWQRNR